MSSIVTLPIAIRAVDKDPGGWVGLDPGHLLPATAPFPVCVLPGVSNLALVSQMTDAELANAAEFIKDRLYFTSIRSPPRRSTDYHFFNVDNELVYEPFFDDFGPVNQAMLYRFCCHLADKLRDRCSSAIAWRLRTCLVDCRLISCCGCRALADKKIVYYTSHDQQKRANGAYLMTAFAIIHLKKNAEEAYAPLMGIQPPFAPFKDVYGGSWNCTIIDCCRAIDKAQQLGCLNFETFNVQEYEVPS